MANKYHDELGRFCSADEMRAGVDRLVAKGDHTAAFALLSEYNSVQESKRSLASRFSGLRPLTGYGSTSEWADVAKSKRGYRHYLAHYLSGEYPEAGQVAEVTSMFVVHASAFKELAERRERQGADVSQDKAVYRSMLKHSLHFFETLSEFGKSSQLMSDSRAESFLLSSIEEADRLGTDQGRIDAIALGKLLDVFVRSIDDPEWGSYPERAQVALKD